MSVFVRYPHFPRVPGLTPTAQRVLEEWGGAMIAELELRDKSANFGPANASPYILANVSILRNFDAGSATLAEVRAVLGTLLYDLQSSGRIA